MTADLTALPDCMQPGLLRLEEPSMAFPRAGLYKEGRYYALKGVEGNLCNVCSIPTAECAEPRLILVNPPQLYCNMQPQ
jgi:predicted metal-binding protein